MRAGDTLTSGEDHEDEQVTRGDALVQVLDASDPRRPPARHALAGVERVVFRRGAAGARHHVEHGRRTLELSIDDRRVSTTHARLARLAGRWIVEDAGSKNGTLVNGVAASRAELGGGDLLELGHTFFLLLEEVEQEAPASGETLVPALAARLAELGRIAPSDVPVLIQGESGTGKERVARAVHDLSGRAGAWVPVNCGALPDTLIEAELFGCKKGAFSGATQDRAGLVRSADGGTLFLDEIGDLAGPSQAALLRVLQEREVLPVGGERPIPVDLRVVAATHRDLAALAGAGRFRGDLLARLAGFRVELPPLRDRREDLGLLVAAILARRGGATFTPQAARALLLHGWPGNVRELELCLAAAVQLAAGSPIALSHLPAAVQEALGRPRADAPAAAPGDEALRAELTFHLREANGNLAEVARRMGKARMQIHRWMRRLRITPDSFRQS